MAAKVMCIFTTLSFEYRLCYTNTLTYSYYIYIKRNCWRRGFLLFGKLKRKLSISLADVKFDAKYNSIPENSNICELQKNKIITHRCQICLTLNTDILRKLIKANIKDGIQHINLLFIITQEMWRDITCPATTVTFAEKF